MASAAVPAYLGNEFKSAPPGHRFGLYFSMWRSDTWERAGDVAKLEALRDVCIYQDDARELTERLIERQQASVDTLGERGFTRFARSTAPFLTGIGMEHPLENGFAFLNPYGLPYLPGSSIKGVLRTAAEELALGLWGETAGWDMLAVWRLFGMETGASYLAGADGHDPDILQAFAKERQDAYTKWVDAEAWEEKEVEGLIRILLPSGKERDHWLEHPAGFLHALTGVEVGGKRLATNNLHLKGALAFWDAILEPPEGKLEIDILNPHHMNYYQEGAAPHDAESPKPNYFLTVPPDSRLRFHVALCESTAMPSRLTDGWHTLLGIAFTHAFEWLGFGAKTAVGYGQMTPEQKAVADLQELFAKEKIAGNNDAGSSLAQGLKSLLDEAEGWPSGERSALCDLAEEILGFLALSRKKKKERRVRIQALREKL